MLTPRFRHSLALGLCLGLCLGLLTPSGVLAFPHAAALLAPGVSAAQEGADSRPAHIWLDAKGHPLPFQGNADIEDYLRNARVVSREEIGTGINRLDKLLLERDGIEAHAIFRDVDVELERTRVGERYYRRFRDFYAGECAAYALAQLLRMDNVPPVVLRSLDG